MGSIPISCLADTLHLGDPSPTLPIPTTVRWVLAVMLATTLVATHSHSPWSSLPRARICRVPPGSVLCLLLLGFPTLGKEPGEEREQNKTKHNSEGGCGAGRGGSGDTKLPARPRGHRRPPGRDLVSPVAARQPVPPFSRGPGGATREACVREADARHSRTSGKPHGARADTEPCAGARPPASKAETAAWKVHRPPPANTFPGRGRHCLPQEMPKTPAWGHGRMACAEVSGSSPAERKDGSRDNSCLCPSAEQIPRCLKSS